MNKMLGFAFLRDDRQRKKISERNWYLLFWVTIVN